MATKIEREREKEKAIHDKMDLILKLLGEVHEEVVKIERKKSKASTKAK